MGPLGLSLIVTPVQAVDARRGVVAGVALGLVAAVGWTSVSLGLSRPWLASSASDGAFVSGPTMSSDRASHTATLLADGTVLIVGGYGDGPIGSAERFDPATLTIREVGSLREVRWYHTATLLDDGSVAIIGGGMDTSLPSVERWAADAFSPGGSLQVGRSIHTATLLDDGTVLAVGGSSSEARATAEHWDPSTGNAMLTGELATGRGWHTATRLSDGRVLIVGGSAQAEIWDPASGEFSAAGSMPEPRWWPTATLLEGDRVLIIGGGVGEGFPGTGEVLASALLWDPSSMTFSLAGALSEPRILHASTLLPDGRVLVIGGGQLPNPPPAIVEMWDPDTMTFSPVGSLSQGRYKPTATLLTDGRVLVAGGGDASGANLDSTELWVRHDR